MTRRRWQEDASPQAQIDIDNLFDECIDLISGQLVKQRGFGPFALAISHDDQRSVRLAPASATNKARILDALVQPGDRATTRAIAVAIDVTLPAGGDAAELLVEHSDGIALQFLVPYHLDKAAPLAIDATTTSIAKRRIWGLRL
ncbi:hypothetical protein IU510_30545 [Nocardia cyriacigeorgica]|uniref:hypothetical protein n=1 Tax=Nocardia cyriacigeorgica TaxID=135487 RepID=UPI0018942611|nr:hypothetical protein [Nocardia cyriacigeorgica]MBF6102361.1 hypothetical protein [Nocardia cyriacigeorgica]MBF6163129.1 hypothetical protein [Nocardia cyriacigeorgica]MBF6202094.1 hypothetical protein [Nocardia cyriacigeorgica]MBF6518581.1 hypothetical protein [Nocardia cyriacigeorgica]